MNIKKMFSSLDSDEQTGAPGREEARLLEHAGSSRLVKHSEERSARSGDIIPRAWSKLSAGAGHMYLFAQDKRTTCL